MFNIIANSNFPFFISYIHSIYNFVVLWTPSPVPDRGLPLLPAPDSDLTHTSLPTPLWKSLIGLPHTTTPLSLSFIKYSLSLSYSVVSLVTFYTILNRKEDSFYTTVTSPDPSPWIRSSQIVLVAPTTNFWSSVAPSRPCDRSSLDVITFPPYCHDPFLPPSPCHGSPPDREV